MHLPLTIAIEWPTPHDLRSRRFWLFAGLAIGGIVAGIVLVRAALTSATQAAVNSASLAITSTPPGATILVAGRERGHTPATLALPPGEYRVTLRLAGRADTAYNVRLIANEATSLDGLLWLRTPETLLVRSPLPGATIVSAQFLDDGRVALAVALPSDDERQLWLLERDGTARRSGPPLASVAIAAAPDGSRVAYLARPATGTPTSAATLGVDGLVTELGVTARDGARRAALRTADEHGRRAPGRPDLGARRHWPAPSESAAPPGWCRADATNGTYPVPPQVAKTRVVHVAF